MDTRELKMMYVTEHWKNLLKPGDFCLSVHHFGDSFGDAPGDPASVTFYEVMESPKRLDFREAERRGAEVEVRVRSFAWDAEDPEDSAGWTTVSIDCISARLTPEEWRIAKEAAWPPTLNLFMEALRTALNRLR